MNKRRKKNWGSLHNKHPKSNAEGTPGGGTRPTGTGTETVPELAGETPAIPIISAPGFGIVHHFTVDAVTIEEAGSSTRHTRREVEGWLAGMNAARRRTSEEDCRRAVAETVAANTGAAVKRGRGEDGRLKIEDRRLKIEDRRLKSDNDSGSLGAAAKESGRKGTSALPETIKAHAKACTPNALASAILCLLSTILVFSSSASEIIRGYAPQDGQQLYAADLDNLVDESVIGVQFYNDQQTTPVLGSGYYFLVLNPANQTYYRINAQQVLYGNTNLFLNAPPEGVPGYGYLLFYDPSNNWVASTTVSNFLWNSASNINVAGLSFVNTNDVGATNQIVLPLWPYPVLSALGQGTNYPVHFLIFDTNGIPYREGLSNLESHVASDMGTVLALPWEYRQEFAPWQLYGTNQTAPYTNAFGFTTNFPITALFQPNNGNTLTNSTLTDTDTVPVNSYQQGVVGLGAPTNTTATLLSIYEYLTNKNTLPPYTIARAQFAGVSAEALTPGGQSITNMDSVNGIITNIALAVNWTNPAAVSWSGVASQIPTVPQVESNTVYWAQVTNVPLAPLSFQLFTNLASAVARTSPITGNGVNPLHTGALYYVTNDTSVNLAVIQDWIGTSFEPGVYDCDFITPSASPYYYMTGSAEWQSQTSTAGDGVSVAFLNYTGWQMVTTNGFRIITAVGTGVAACPLVQVVVNPQ